VHESAVKVGIARQWCTAYSAPSMKDSSRHGTRHCLGQNAAGVLPVHDTAVRLLQYQHTTTRPERQIALTTKLKTMG